jgi:hypothetical protein
VKTKRDVIAPNRYSDSDELGERKFKGHNRVVRELGKFTLWREWASESSVQLTRVRGRGCGAVHALVIANISGRFKLEGAMVLVIILGERGCGAHVCAFIHMWLKFTGAFSRRAYIDLTTKSADLSNIRSLATDPDDRDTAVTMRDHVMQEQAIIKRLWTKLEG